MPFKGWIFLKIYEISIFTLTWIKKDKIQIVIKLIEDNNQIVQRRGCQQAGKNKEYLRKSRRRHSFLLI